MNNYFSRKVSLVYLICTLFVVMIHANNLDLFSAKGIQLPHYIIFLENFITDNLCRIAVPMFMFLSAFLLYSNLIWNNVLDKMKRRIRTLLIPYLMWNTVYMIVFYFLSYLPFINQARFQLSLDIIINSIFFYAFNSAYWFMFQLIIYVALCPFIYLIMKNKNIGFFIILATYFLNLFVHIPRLNFMSFFFYLIGCFSALHYKDLFMKKPTKSGRIKCLVVFIITQIIWVFNFYNFIEVEKTLLWFFMMISLYFLIDNGNINLSSEISKIHFFIYSSHVIILETLEKLMFLFFPYNSLTCLIDFFVTPLLTILICVIAAILMKKGIRPLYCLMTGER